MANQTSKGPGLRPKQVAARLGCSVATFYRKAKNDPDWPKIIKISDRISICTEASIDAFIAKKEAAS